MRELKLDGSKVRSLRVFGNDLIGQFRAPNVRKEILCSEQVTRLIDHLDQHVRAKGCDHTMRFASRWAEEHRILWQDLQDTLDQASVFCDCEIVLNRDERQPLVLKLEKPVASAENRWQLPPSFQLKVTTVDKIIVGRAGVGKNNHVSSGEWLIPASIGANLRRRMRKLVHFFIGLTKNLCRN